MQKKEQKYIKEPVDVEGRVMNRWKRNGRRASERVAIKRCGENIKCENERLLRVKSAEILFISMNFSRYIKWLKQAAMASECMDE